MFETRSASKFGCDRCGLEVLESRTAGYVRVLPEKWAWVGAHSNEVKITLPYFYSEVDRDRRYLQYMWCPRCLAEVEQACKPTMSRRGQISEDGGAFPLLPSGNGAIAHG